MKEEPRGGKAEKQKERGRGNLSSGDTRKTGSRLTEEQQGLPQFLAARWIPVLMRGKVAESTAGRSKERGREGRKTRRAGGRRKTVSHEFLG